MCDRVCHPPTLPWVGTSRVPTGAGFTMMEFDPGASTFVTLDFERAVCRGSSSRVSPATARHPCTPRPLLSLGGAATQLCPSQAGVAWTLWQRLRPCHSRVNGVTLTLPLGLADGDTRWALQRGGDVAAGCDHSLCSSFCRARPALGKDAGVQAQSPHTLPDGASPHGQLCPCSSGAGRWCCCQPGGRAGGKLIPGSVAALSPMAI